MSAIFLRGNLSDGFEPVGPYPDIGAALEAHDGDEGWGMSLTEGRTELEPRADIVDDVPLWKRNLISAVWLALDASEGDTDLVRDQFENAIGAWTP